METVSAADYHDIVRVGDPRLSPDGERIARWFDGYSEHHDTPRALDRGEEGLSAGEPGR